MILLMPPQLNVTIDSIMNNTSKAKESISTKLFLGWFGPHGHDSIVFSVIVLNRNLPGSRFMTMMLLSLLTFTLQSVNVFFRLQYELYGKPFPHSQDHELP